MRGFSHGKIRPLHIKRISQRQWYFWLPALLYLIGILAGTWMEESGRAGGQAYALYFTKQVLSIYAQGSFTQVMGYTFLSQFAFQCVVLFFSFSCIGAPAILLMPLCKGISLGCVSGYLYAALGLQGVLTNLFLFWLPQIGEACLLFFFVSRALALSVNLFSYNVLEKKSTGSAQTQQCLGVFLVTSLGGVFTSALSGILCSVFAPVFLR